jgi:hypothetical protein
MIESFGGGAAGLRKLTAVLTIMCMIVSLALHVTFAADTAPTVDNINPSTGSSAGGYEVTISGSGFTAGKTTVKFGAQDAEVISNDGTVLTVTVPARINFESGPSQPVNVTVGNEVGETTLADGFTYIQSNPVIESVTPQTGTAGTEITLVGSDFIKDCIVVIGGIESTRVTYTDSTLIKAVVPANTAGVKSIKVVNPDGGSTTEDECFTYEKSTPSITKIEPNKGLIHTMNPITITGTNFVPDSTEVRIGNQPATGVVVINQTTLTALTPVFDTVGKRHVTVTVDGVSAMLYNGYEYISNPKVTGVNPESGSVLGGDTVYIEGQGFVNGASVKFGTKSAVNVEWKTSGLLTAVTPPASEPGFVSVTVTNPDDGTYTEDNLFEYTRSAPFIDDNGISPASGSVLGGTAITIKGGDFRSGVKVYIDERELMGLERISLTELKGQTPSNDSPGGKIVKVQNPDGGFIELADGYTYVRTNPQITGFTPETSSSVPEAGAQVIISGSDFVSGAVVTFGTKQAEIISIQANEIKVKIPENLPGKYKITVKNPDKGQATSDQDFTYELSTPTITTVVNVRVKDLIGEDVAAGASAGGTQIRLTGTQFSEGVRIYVGSKPAQVISSERALAEDTVTVVTPAGNIGMTDIRVVNPDNQEAVASFKYIIAPTISDLFPSSGFTTGDADVTISGSGFKSGLRVFFGGVEAQTINFEDSTRIIVTTPENSEGSKDVVIINTDDDYGMAEKQGGFTYKLPPSRPSITGFSPVSGSTEGGTIITIDGTDFRDGAVVKVGDVPAVVISNRTVTEDGITYNIIEAETQPGPAGDYRITIINPDGGTAASDGYFTYKTMENALTVGSITPNSGTVEGGTQITIVGANFAAQSDPLVTRVTIGGNPVTGLTVSADKRRLTGYTPGGTIGLQDVVVVNYRPADGVIVEEVRISGGFTYIAPQSQPFIESITPLEGPASGGTKVIITGVDFDSGAEVFFGSLKSNDVNVLDTIQIEAVTPKTVQVGAVTVKVINSDGGTAVYDSFRYRGNTLVLSDVVPAYGSAAGLEEIIIKGANFLVGTKVDIGGEPAPEVTVEDAETLRILTPPNTVGTKDVKVYNDYGSEVLKGAFTYYLAQSRPLISSVSGPKGDNTISAAGGETIHIYGTDFRTGVQVLIGGVECQQATAVNIGEVTAVTPAGVPGSADLYMENPDGGAAYQQDAFLYISSPIINSLDPAVGAITGGTPVTIYGKNFEGDVEVSFGGISSQAVEVESEKILRVITPPHTAGFVDVKVVNTTDGGEFTKTSAFRYKIPSTSPEINSILPNQGTTDGGTLVTVSGDGFEQDAFVVVGGRRALDVKYIDPRTLVFKTPPGQEGSKDVYVINASDTGQAVLIDGFTYKTPLSSPTVSKVEPDKGTIFGGTDITITGTDFRSGAIVIIGGSEAGDVEVVSPIRIKAATPPRPIGKASVTVMNPDAGSATLTDGFEYMAPTTLPEIDGINPAKGTTKGGTVVTIAGKEFVEGARVFIGGEMCPSVEFVNSDNLIVVTPANTPGLKDVAVVNPDTALAKVNDGFEYIVAESAPTIKSIGPKKGSVLGGTRVTLQGSDFRLGLRVTFGGREGQVVSICDEQGTEVNGSTVVSGVSAVVVTPPGTPGVKDVVLENTDTGVATLTGGFEYINATEGDMQIEAIRPSKGRVQGGTPVTITGSGFEEGALVYIGGKPATNVHVCDENTIKARTPANTVGKKDVTVQNPDGSTANLEEGFEYMVPGEQPDILSIEPNKGSSVGGTQIEITGRNFDNPTVYIGENPAELVTAGDTLIVAITPEGFPGIVDVIVVNEDTGLDLLEEGFTYMVYPAVVSVSPNQGPAGGGTRITITGEYFATGAQVFIGGKAATEVNFISENTLTAVTPEHEPGTKPVLVINPDGGTGELAQGFTYIAPRTAPLVPEDVRVRAEDSRTVRLIWSPALHANLYEIYISTSRSGPFEFIEKTERTTYYLNDLEPDTRYYIRIRAVNELGVSEFTITRVVTTDKGKTDTPEKPSITESTAGSCATVTINDEDAFDSTTVFEMLTEDPKITTWSLVFAYDAVSGLNKDVWVKAPGVTVRIPGLTLDYPLKDLDKNESQDAGIIFSVDRLTGQERETVMRRLPKGKVALSPIYRLSMAKKVGSKPMSLSAFYPNAWMYIEPDNLYKTDYRLYRYDEYDREWTEVSDTQNVPSATIYLPGIYAIIGM